jgi:hypothetical protein
MNLPFFKQLLSSNDTSLTQAEVVMILTPKVIRTHELRQLDLAPINIGTQQNIGLTGPPPLIGPAAGEGVTEPRPQPQGGAIGGAAPTGVPTPPAAAAPGLPEPPAAPAPGLPESTTPPGVRLPEGTTPRPTTPEGSSPIPGTTTAPPPQTPAPPAPEQAPAAAAPTAAQVVLSLPTTEFRVGAGPYTVPISINGVSQLSVISLSLTFDPAILRVRSVQEGGFLRQGGVAVTFTQQVDPAAGRLDISMTRTGDTTGASGSGLLAAVLFDAAAAGNVTLALSGVGTNPQGQPVPLTLAPATVVVKQ